MMHYCELLVNAPNATAARILAALGLPGYEVMGVWPKGRGRYEVTAYLWESKTPL